MHVLDPAKAFPACDARGRYSRELEELRHVAASGVYAIIQANEILYVGESHSGRLFDTITRHFREWRPENDPQGRRRGGTMYDRRKVRVCYQVTEADTAQTLQYAEIERLRPRDNSIDGNAIDTIPI